MEGPAEPEGESEPGHGEIPSRLIDLSGIDLGGLAAIKRPVLMGALQRIRDEVAHPEEAVAGFNASL